VFCVSGCGLVNVSLRLVTNKNWEQVASLKVSESQTQYVSTNAYSLAEASYRTHCQPRAIYLEEDVVGFLMYAGLEPLKAPKEVEIFRLMIDFEHQGKGIGRMGLSLALDEIRSLKGVESILICYVPSNPIAKGFYSSFGFVETGLDDHGEMMAEIQIGTQGDI
jgi:diamine N-acetyltransferase